VTTAAFNALLKTLEEPPPWIVFIFATTDYRKIPATILSRCQQFVFRPLAMPMLIGHLRSICAKEGITISDRSLHRIAQMASGSSRDALSLLDQLVAYGGADVKDDDMRLILNILPADVSERVTRALVDGRGDAVLEEIRHVVESGYELINFLHDMESYLRQVLVARVAASPEAILDAYEEDLPGLKKVAALFSEDAEILRFLQFVMQIDANVRFVHNPRHLIEAGFLAMCHFRKLVPISEAYRVVEQASKGRLP